MKSSLIKILVCIFFSTLFSSKYMGRSKNRNKDFLNNTHYRKKTPDEIKLSVEKLVELANHLQKSIGQPKL